MKRGRKPEPPAVKALRGTFQPVRDADRVELVVADAPPCMPETGLTPEAEVVWQEEIGRVIAAGNTELDSSLFADYCELTAVIRKAWKEGIAPPAAYLTNVRQMRELLGIGGRKSRVGVKPDGSAKANPFARNGRR